MKAVNCYWVHKKGSAASVVMCGSHGGGSRCGGGLGRPRGRRVR
jgi:hypothetical protein